MTNDFKEAVMKEQASKIFDLEAKIAIAVQALEQCKVYSECYEELIQTIDSALEKLES